MAIFVRLAESSRGWLRADREAWCSSSHCLADVTVWAFHCNVDCAFVFSDQPGFARETDRVYVARESTVMDGNILGTDDEWTFGR